jgi:hypothetical protein
LGHLAGFAGVRVRWGWWEALLLKQFGDLMLDSFRCKSGDVASEVFDGVKESLVFGDGNANYVEFGIEEVGAVGGGSHPDDVERGGRVSVASDVFRDGSEVGAGVCAASDEVGFAGVLVEEVVGIAENPLEVGFGGAGEGVVPCKWGKIVCFASLIRELKEGLLGRTCGLGLRLGAGVRGCGCKDCDGEE